MYTTRASCALLTYAQYRHAYSLSLLAPQSHNQHSINTFPQWAENLCLCVSPNNEPITRAALYHFLRKDQAPIDKVRVCPRVTHYKQALIAPPHTPKPFRFSSFSASTTRMGTTVFPWTTFVSCLKITRKSEFSTTPPPLPPKLYCLSPNTPIHRPLADPRSKSCSHFLGIT